VNLVKVLAHSTFQMGVSALPHQKMLRSIELLGTRVAPPSGKNSLLCLRATVEIPRLANARHRCSQPNQYPGKRDFYFGDDFLPSGSIQPEIGEIICMRSRTASKPL
jgi:hypothetical protein